MVVVIELLLWYDIVVPVRYYVVVLVRNTVLPRGSIDCRRAVPCVCEYVKQEAVLPKQYSYALGITVFNTTRVYYYCRIALRNVSRRCFRSHSKGWKALRNRLKRNQPAVVAGRCIV